MKLTPELVLNFDSILKDDQWAAIKKASQLPDNARLAIDYAIDEYQSMQRGAFLSKPESRALLQLAKRAKSTELRILILLKSKDAFAADPESKPRKRVERLLHELQDFQKWVTAARKGRGPGKPLIGRSMQLVFRLGTLHRAFSGKKALSQSKNNNNWVWLVWRIAQPDANWHLVHSYIKKFAAWQKLADDPKMAPYDLAPWDCETDLEWALGLPTVEELRSVEEE